MANAKLPGMTMTTGKHLAAATLLASLALGLSGCAPVPLTVTGDIKLAQAPTKEVKTAGACIELGETHKSAMPREEFIGKIANLLANQRTAAAAQWVQRYPDIAWDVLRSANGAEAIHPAVRFIAQIHDEVNGTSGRADSWLATLENRAAHADAFKAYDTACVKVRELERTGKFAEAAAAASGCQVPSKLLAIEVARLHGEALLLADRPTDALKVLSAGLENAKTASAYQTVQLSLLLGEAHRRAGHKDQAGAAWQQTVLLAGNLLTQPRPINDPALWERIAALRPVHVAWPAVPGLTEPGKGALDETQLWTHMGKWRLDRGEAQTALLAFKRAESMAQDRGSREYLQLQQAKALLQLDQRASALALLAKLAEDPQCTVAGPTLATLGSIKLKEGNRQQALALLQAAVERQPGKWASRAEAEANLGLAYLMSGDEPNGLRCLHEAQAHFQTQHADDMLVQCLANEANYLERVDKKTKQSA